ncbi:MAG: hypothetical protein GVY07_14575 [Bacteroidetes bacterium]|jgi:uncharacterized YigZ family protein|nr:hypothetical protein [Bacteroidota bacterium]
MDINYTVTRVFTAKHTSKGSDFIAYLIPCETSESADSKGDEIKHKHPAATHYCYAFRIGAHVPAEWSQDDGEPAGTAGRPILNTLRSAKIVHAMGIVVRYYGGTKLGKRGLIDAYSSAIDAAVQASQLKHIVPTLRYRIRYAYDQQSVIEKLKHSYNLFDTDSSYGRLVTLTVDCPLSQNSRFQKKLNSLVHLFKSCESLGDSFHVYA